MQALPELSEYVRHYPLNLGVANATVLRYPVVKVRATDEQLALNPVVRQRVVRIGESIPEPADRAPAVVSEGAQREVGVRRRRERDALDHDQPRAVLADHLSLGRA